MNTRPMFLRWPARRPILDNQACSDLDATIPPRLWIVGADDGLQTTHFLFIESAVRSGNQAPTYQRPTRKPMRLTGVIAIAAVVGAVVMAALAPVQTYAIVAMALEGSR